jgi:predicted transposase/invertase (TIGR01784 family)
MAEEIHNPHDALVRAVLGDVTAARSFLQIHLPQKVSQALNWPTLKRLEGSFIDEDLRGSEADLLYEVEHISNEGSVWVYLLVEHQSSADRWMRFRLLKYCCRIWEAQLNANPRPDELRPIVPLVFYQGERRWPHTTEFADLFAESARDWPGVPSFAHELIDQSGLQVDAVQGEEKVQIMQLLLLAAYHPSEAWMERVAALWNSLSSLGPSGGMNYVRVFVLYILATQEPEATASFREVLSRYVPGAGDDVMTYAQQLLAEGRAEGRAESEAKGKMIERVTLIENLLREGVDWSLIERATGLDETQFEALKQQLADMGS